MSGFLTAPRLPDSPVKLALVSGEYPFLAHRLEQLGIEAITTDRDSRLPEPVRYHPDMQGCLLDGEQIFVLQKSPLKEKLSRYSFDVWETESEPVPHYPGDAMCNNFTLSGFLIGNPASMDPNILERAESMGLKPLAVRQGYASCAVSIVNRHSVITADPGIAAAMGGQGFDVLLIRQGFIDLPGYDTGFIGGCCGLLAPDIMGVSGKLSSHPDGSRIRDFLKAQGVSVLELSDENLLDAGGIIPLMD